MICYHTTDAAEAILRDGFQDRTDRYLFAEIEMTGVWLGDSPMDENEGATGNQVLQVEFPDDVDLCNFEVPEEHKPYREWCVPAALINERATVTWLSEDDVEELACERVRKRFGPGGDLEGRELPPLRRNPREDD